MKKLKILLCFVCSISFYSNSQENNPMDLNRIQGLEPKIERILKTPETASKYLSIRIFPDELFDDSIKSDLIYRNDFEGVISVLTLNMEEAVKSINREEIKHWNLNDEELFSLAEKQTKKNVASISFESADVNENMKYYFAYDDENYFVNSLIFFPEFYTKFDESKKGIIIGMPVRHMFTIMPINSTQTIYDDLSVYYNFLIQIYTNELNPTTLKMFLYKNGDFYPISVLYDDEDNFVRFLAPEILTR